MPLHAVLWDWNGTLLDDVTAAMEARNRVFPRHGLPPIADADAYRSAFCFPVREYYRRGGVTDALFPTVANEWMDEYMRISPEIPLRAGARAALAAFGAAGLRQAILSASEIANLRAQTDALGVTDCFEAITGLSHIYATSKIETGIAFLRDAGWKPTETLMVGDTLHDADVARALGCRCCLVAGGHQGEAMLRASGEKVVTGLKELVDAVLGAG